MFPFPFASTPVEWPKLDLAKSHLTRLSLAWTVPYSPFAVLAFGSLLGDEGYVVGVLSYSRRKFRHLRIETAQPGIAEDDALVVAVQYTTDIGALGPIPRSVQQGAWLLDPLHTVAVAPLVRCHADFAFASSPALQTAVPLPLPVPDLDRFAAIDELTGVQGIKYAAGGDATTGYRFLIDRQPSGEVVLSLEFAIAAGPAEDAPGAALEHAVAIARSLVWEKEP